MNTKPRKDKQKTPWLMQGHIPAIFYIARAEFESLKEYLKILAIYLEGEETKFRKKIDTEKPGGLNEIEEDYYYDAHLEELNKRRYFFPNTFRASVLITSCSLFESLFSELCSYIEKDIKPIKVKMKDIYKTFRDTEAFLEENFFISIGKHPNWEKIKDYYQIRNVIVHAQGELYKQKNQNKQKTQEAIQRLKDEGVPIDIKNDKIQISESFLRVMLEDIITFLKALETAFIDNTITGPKYWP